MGYIITLKLKFISQINKIHTNDDQNSLEKEILYFYYYLNRNVPIHASHNEQCDTLGGRNILHVEQNFN